MRFWTADKWTNFPQNGSSEKNIPIFTPYGQLKNFLDDQTSDTESKKNLDAITTIFKHFNEDFTGLFCTVSKFVFSNYDYFLI